MNEVYPLLITQLQILDSGKFGYLCSDQCNEKRKYGIFKLPQLKLNVKI